VGFESLCGFDVQYWNDIVQIRVAEAIIQLLQSDASQIAKYLAIEMLHD
jgi:hypothetical protein